MSQPSQRRQFGNLAFLGVPVVAASYLMDRAHPGWLGDFGCFLLSGWAVRTGQDPYLLDPQRYPFGLTWTGAPNLNPPVSLPFWAVIAALPPETAMLVWTVGSALLYVGVLAALVRFGGRPLGLWHLAWAAGFGGFWYTLQVGQIYVPLLALCAIAVLALRRDKSLLAGVALGLLGAIKPNFLLWPALLFVGPNRRAGIVAGVTSVLVDLVTALIYGPEVYRSWLRVLPAAGVGSYTLDLSVFAVTTRLGLPGLGLPLAGALVLGVVLWTWRARPEVERLGLVALVVILLASPVTWIGYTVLLLPALLARRGSPLGTVAALLLLTPPMAVFALGPLSPVLALGYPLSLGLILGEAVTQPQMTAKLRWVWATRALGVTTSTTS